jgi:hypothetical protein
MKGKSSSIPMYSLNYPHSNRQLSSLAAISLASKASEHPRRLREILVPAYQFRPHRFLKLTLSIVNPDKPPLTFPSDLYDSLRYSTVTSELILLRILKFELRILLPQAYLPRLISRVLPPDDQPSDTELKETTLYRRTHAKIVQAYGLF